MAELTSLAVLLADANLVSYWRFEGNSNDVKGTNNGTDTAMAYGVANGKYQQGASFVAASSAHINLPTGTTLNVANITFTLAFWIKTSETTQEEVFGKGGTNATLGYAVNINQGNVSGNLTFAWGNGAGVSTNSVTSAGFNDGLWHHIAMVITTNTLTAGSNTMICYVDGVSKTVTQTANFIYADSLNVPVFGYREPVADSFYNGSLDDFCFFSRALSAAEVFLLANNFRGLPSVGVGN